MIVNNYAREKEKNFQGFASDHNHFSYD